jgi:hypothetical protein
MMGQSGIEERFKLGEHSVEVLNMLYQTRCLLLGFFISFQYSSNMVPLVLDTLLTLCNRVGPLRPSVDLLVQ